MNLPVKTIIPAFYRLGETPLSAPETEPYLEIAEFFCDTIQGEGVYTGQPCTFLRMYKCTQSCIWCDTKEVWRHGNPYTFGEIFELMDKYKVANKFRNGQHLVLTGGSPVRQQDGLTLFIHAFITRYGFKPTIQIENECTIMPKPEFVELIDIWNNSPKLLSSGNKTAIRYRPEILSFLSSLPDSWFKFVVFDDLEWIQIMEDYVYPGYIKKEQIVLMPLGATRKELQKNRETIIKMAVTHGVRYSTREHIIVWDKKTGI